MEKSDVAQLQSRLKDHQKESSSVERQLHDMRAQAERAKKLKKEAEDKRAEYARESEKGGGGGGGREEDMNE